MPPVYLDNNATTRPAPEVVAAMMPYFSELFANPSSAHGPGAGVAEAVRAARRAVQALIGAAREQEIIFTSGGTEANNTALRSALERDPERQEIVTSVVEHPAILTLCEALEKKRGVVVHRIAVDRQGRLDLDGYRRALGPRTALVSLMWANNETGTIFPVRQLAALAHQAGALFHTDAVQAVGKLAIDLQATEIDMLSFSGHKLHGPKGIGVLYLKKGTPYEPLIRGGHQERARRGGTENVPAIIGLGVAADLARGRLARDAARIMALRDRFEAGVLATISDSVVNGDPLARLGNTSNIAFDRAEGEVILTLLDRAGIAASSGSACTSGSTEPSHVLRAMKLPYTAAPGAIRFTFSRENTEQEVEQILAILPAIVEQARAVSPFARQPPDIGLEPRDFFA